MSYFGLKITKGESPDKTPYTVYYPHSIDVSKRVWNQPYYQVVSIDPARKNYAIRIERRYNNGYIQPIVFDKVSIECFVEEKGVLINNTYQELTNFLNKYKEFYNECHYIIIERQLPQNYKACRIAQHTISYFSIILSDKPLLPSIVEVDPKLKTKMLEAPKGLTDRQIKLWATETGTQLLVMRNDNFSLEVLKYFRTKQDDLCDTICMIEGLFKLWGLPLTKENPPMKPPGVTLKINQITNT